MKTPILIGLIITIMSHEQVEHDALIGSLFDESDSKTTSPQITPVATPDVSMVNMLRYGLLALQLLPEKSNAGIVIVSDRMLNLPNANMLESMLTQLRNSTIACSFLQIGSCPHPYACLGYVPNVDLMKFISTATFGAYLPTCPDVVSVSCSFTKRCIKMISIYPQSSTRFTACNVYHRAFLAWNFQRGLFGFRADMNYEQIRNRTNIEWAVE